VAAVLVACLAVDVAAAPGLASGEHLLAVAVGVGSAMALTRRRRGARLAPSSLAAPTAPPPDRSEMSAR
jgi:hypothetical protein